MSAQRGKDLLLKVDVSGTFETVAGLRTTRLSFNAEAVDATTAESVGRWRELLDGAGLKTANISGAGIFKDATADTQVKTLFFNGTIVSWQIIIPDFGTIEGPFQITGLEYAGVHNDVVTYEVSLASAGALTFSAL